MAKNIKDEGEGGAKAGHNGFDPKVVKSCVDRIENVLADIESERGEFMAVCKAKREDIADIYEEAKARGIPKGELKKVIKTRDLERKVEKIRAELDAENQETYDQIRHALGDLADLPLGGAALDKAAKKAAAEDDKDLRSTRQRKPKVEPAAPLTAEEIGAENARKVMEFIKPLPPKNGADDHPPSAA